MEEHLVKHEVSSRPLVRCQACTYFRFRFNMNLAVILHGFVICSCYMNFSMACGPLSGLHIFSSGVT